MLEFIKDRLFPSKEYALDRCIEILLPFYIPETAGYIAADMVIKYGGRKAIKEAKRVAKHAVRLPLEEE